MTANGEVVLLAFHFFRVLSLDPDIGVLNNKPPRFNAFVAVHVTLNFETEREYLVSFTRLVSEIFSESHSRLNSI